MAEERLPDRRHFAVLPEMVQPEATAPLPPVWPRCVHLCQACVHNLTDLPPHSTLIVETFLEVMFVQLFVINKYALFLKAQLKALNAAAFLSLYCYSSKCVN